MSDPDKADDMDRILDRFGHVQEEYEHLGGYALESQAREVWLRIQLRVALPPPTGFIWTFYWSLRSLCFILFPQEKRTLASFRLSASVGCGGWI